jgi:hypothetical protein
MTHMYPPPHMTHMYPPPHMISNNSEIYDVIKKAGGAGSRGFEFSDSSLVMIVGGLVMIVGPFRV